MFTISNLTAFQAEQLLQFFFYEMPMEQRERLMATLPRAYNAYCGCKVVEVVNVSRAEPVLPPLSKTEEQKKQVYNA